MGIMDNLRKIKKYNELAGRERNLEQELIRKSDEDTKFIHEYATFVEGLKDKLTVLFDIEEYEEVYFAPTTTDNAKYFRALLDDKEFREYYYIKKTSGGEFVFKLKSLDDDYDSEYDVDDYEDDEELTDKDRYGLF